MDAVSAKPQSIVEAVVRPRGKLDDHECVDHGALRRRAPELEVELDGLTDELAKANKQVKELNDKLNPPKDPSKPDEK